MIPEIEIKKLVEKLSSERIIKFFRKNVTNTVYFHHLSEDSEVSLGSSDNVEEIDLKLPTLEIEDGTFLVAHSNESLSKTLAKDDFQVASITVRKLVELAQSLPAVNGIAVQCNSCYFTVDIEELLEGLAE